MGCLSTVYSISDLSQEGTTAPLQYYFFPKIALSWSQLCVFKTSLKVIPFSSPTYRWDTQVSHLFNPQLNTVLAAHIIWPEGKQILCRVSTSPHRQN